MKQTHPGPLSFRQLAEGVTFKGCLGEQNWNIRNNLHRNYVENTSSYE
jgi:hypothetical protein